jgi:Peroxiredoxin
MKISRYVLASAFVLAVASCSDKAQIEGTLTDAPRTDVVVKQLNGSSFNVLDTLKTDDSGKYSYRMDISEGQPEFIYVFKGDTRLASLILQKGDKVRIVSDTLGNYSVSGSEECEKLLQVEKDYSAFLGRMNAAATIGDNAALSKEYVEYYRGVLKYVMSNMKSLTSIPVLYQRVNAGFPVFSQQTDALVFKNVHDSLVTVYPQSKYVAALGEEAARRTNAFNFSQQIREASEAGFPDIDLPGIDGTKVKLSDVKAKAILVYFWVAFDAAQKMYNQDALVPVYNDFHSKGFEIYSVSLDADKGTWASTVKRQNLPWVNVCDPTGRVGALYNVSKLLPVAYLIVDGVLSPATIQNETELRKALSSKLQ